MLRSLRHLMFALPALMLAFLVGVSAVTESRIASNGDLILGILGDQSARSASEIQDAVWALYRTFDIYKPGENPDILTRRIAGIGQGIDGTRASIAAMPREAAQRRDELAALGSLETKLAKIKDGLERFPDDAVLRIMRRDTSSMAAASRDLVESLRAVHDGQVAQALDMLRRQEAQRTALYAMILVCCFMLGYVLLLNARAHRRNAEMARAAERANAMFAAALQSTAVGVLIRDMRRKERKAVFVNRAFTAMTGYSFADAADKEPGFFFDGGSDTATVRAVHEAVDGNRPIAFNLLTRRKEGAPFWSEWHMSPVTDKDGHLTHYVSLLTDITLLRQAQEALMQAKEQAEKASRIKSNFLAMMSHEIRTPINGLLGIMNLLNDTPLDIEQRSYLNIALTSGRGLNEIINDVLDYSKIEAGKIAIVARPFALHALLEDVVGLTQPSALEKSLLLDFSIGDAVPADFTGDAGRIRQILLNLVTNAIKCTDQGSVTIRVGAASKNERDGSGTLPLRFDVIDTGCGIAAEDRNKLFKDFSQIEAAPGSRQNGSGLGLAITRRLVELMGGKIGVESAPGKGSAFWFELPLPVALKLAAPEPEAGTPRAANAFLAGKKILLVEDNDVNRLVARRYLEKFGCRPDFALTGLEAVEKARATAYDAILMDCAMPEMDGIEATRRIRLLGGWAAAVPIIALTAYVMPDDRDRCLAAGMDDFLGKPVERESMQAMLERWLAKGEGRPVPLNPAPTPSSAALPILDEKTLRRLTEDLDTETMMRITGTFLDSIVKRIGMMRASAGKDDFPAVRLEAHALKASSGHCGLRQFSALMAEIELAAAAPAGHPRVMPLLRQIGPAIAAARQSLLMERERYQA